MTGKKSTIQKKGRFIKIRGGEEVYTRLGKREYEGRREIFDDNESYGSTPEHLQNYSYDEWTEWGAMGGRPRKWANDAERKRYERAKKKLELGQPLTNEERRLLGLIKSRPGTYQSDLGRPMTSAERKRKQRLKNNN